MKKGDGTVEKLNKFFFDQTIYNDAASSSGSIGRFD